MNALLTVEEAAVLLRCSRSQVYKLLSTGILQRGVRFGRRTVIHEWSVTEALEAQPPAVPGMPKRLSKKAFAAAIDAVCEKMRR